MQEEAYSLIQTEVERYSGIRVQKDDEKLFESRLRRLMTQESLQSLDEVLSWVKANQTSWIETISKKMANHETYFFREPETFALILNELLPEIKSKDVSIWSAACSTGQEPYSIAMMIYSNLSRLSFDRVEIYATDFVDDVLKKAESGTYTQFEIQRGLAALELITFFEKEGKLWRIKPEIRKSVLFRKLNLMDSNYYSEKHDIIFLRNVLIYFNPETRRKVLKKIRNNLKPNGVLVLGSTESLFGMEDLFRRIPNKKTSMYTAVS